MISLYKYHTGTCYLYNENYVPIVNNKKHFISDTKCLCIWGYEVQLITSKNYKWHDHKTSF